MRKLLVVLICLFCGSTISLNAQDARLEARDAEWKGYSLPKTNFTRQVTPDKSVVFRVPEGWKQEGSELVFVGPHDARLLVTAEKVPDGYPLTEYVASTLKATADVLASPESILTRRTQFQDLEAREIYFESPNDDGKLYRSTTWITISGPLVVRASFVVDMDHATALEPFFKATVQSLMFVPTNFGTFELARTIAMMKPAAEPRHEIENIIASLNELNSDREAAIKRLTPLFVSQTEAAVDLLLDRRAVVRSVAAEALTRSNNSLKDFLWYVLDDSDPFIAETAARRLGSETDIATQLVDRSWSKQATPLIARLWPFMSKENRARFMQGAFRGKTPDWEVQTAALVLLRTMPASELKLPFASIMAANHEPLKIVGLRVANDRGESLPVDALMKLAISPNAKIKTLAAESLGQSAAVSDIPRIEALVSKTPIAAAAKQKETAARKAFEEEIKLSIKKIRFRNDLSLVKNVEEGREIIRKAASDPTLRDFAWRFDCEATVGGCAPASAARNLPSEFTIKSFAENLFPQKTTHYTAIPNPAQSVQRFYETLHGLQLDSPRAQASLILMIGSFRERLGQELGAPPEATALIDYTGIKPDSPIVLGGWTAVGAHDSVGAAQRRAIVVRVKDREPFERAVESFQRASGSFMYLTDYLGIGTRAAAAIPALLPFSAQAALAADPDKPSKPPQMSQSFVGRTEWNGIPIKTIEHRWLDSDWDLSIASTYVAFIGDVAILTPDIATIRDLLSNAATAEQQLLAGNEEFRRAVGADGDIVYFSNLKALLADPNDKSFDEVKTSSESGALKFSSSSWENSHRLVFDESDWSKPLLPFHPKDLSAPRELLPSSTLAYFMLKLDVAAAWNTWPRAMNLREFRFEIDPASWSLNFDKEVLPELGPECGAVLLDLPNVYEKDIQGGTWAAFCKLKSNKLADAFTAGKLLRGVGPTTGTAEIKNGETSYFVGVKNGFLVVSNSSKGLSSLDGKTTLATARDYSRAVEKTPAGIVAFGGYNLEAAVAAAKANAGDGLRAQVAGMVFSIASAFHSQSFFATAATAGTIEGRSSVAMDREGRYAVADFNYLPRGANITFATLQPHGMPILDQRRLSDIVLKVRAKAPGPIDSIRDDVNLPTQKVEQKSPNEMVVTVGARRYESDKKVELPVTNPEVAAFLKASGEISSDDKNVIERARQIAGDDCDAWSVARKLADWTHSNLEWKSVARAGAAETLATREADCSEFSQLYVSMARSLGLPARIVSGLAYSGSSFGGHAWVEVWIGEWIELDPTWGTHFVDATHIRNKESTLVTAAALNLIDVEVLETRRTVSEYQKSAKTLAQHFATVLPLGNTSEIEATLDLPTLTDEFMGAGAWNGLNEKERSQIASVYRRLTKEIVENYSGETANNVHVLHLEEKGERAEVLTYVSDQDLLLKLQLLRRNDVWYLVDVVQPDPGLQVAGEKFRPVIKSIEANRAGKKTTPSFLSDYAKAMSLLYSDAAKAVAEADRQLQIKPGDQAYRFLKMMALWEMEEEEKKDESIRMLTELSNERFAPAIYRLAGVLSEEKPEEAIALYKRYSTLEPYDFRPYRDLGVIHETLKQTELAEAAYRKAIDLDPPEIPGYENLATFLIRNGRVAEVPAVLRAADKYVTENDEVLVTILDDLEDEIKLEDAEWLATKEAQRMKGSVWANLGLSDIYIREKRYPEAVEIVKRAVQIAPESYFAHVSLSLVYLKQSRWTDSLKAIDKALSLNDKSGNSHYIRASALARLGRKKEAMTALGTAIELDDEILTFIADDEDLKSLRTLHAFQKLLEQAKKQASETSPQ
jgi:tetratricopeptide (TPR) repeat protein